MADQVALAELLAGGTDRLLIHGDGPEVLAALPRGRDSLDLVPGRIHLVSDPPYSLRTHKGMRGNRGAEGIVTRDPGFGHLSARLRRALAREAARVATGWIVLFSDWESISWWRISLEAAGGSYRRAIPWVRWSSPQFNALAPPCGSEAVLVAKPRDGRGGVFWLRGNRTRYPNPEEGLESRAVYEEKCLRANSKDKVWQTQKPLTLMASILSDTCKPGDLVVDPCMGSGTTGVAALAMGCRFLGIERDPRAYDLARERIGS